MRWRSAAGINGPQVANDEEGTLENLKVADALFAAVLSGDKDAMRAQLHPDFELHHADRIPYGGVYKGVDGFLRFIDIFMAYWDIEALDRCGTYLSEEGDIVLDFLLKAKMKTTGEAFETTMLEKWEFKDGKIIKVTPHYYN